MWKKLVSRTLLLVLVAGPAYSHQEDGNPSEGGLARADDARNDKDAGHAPSWVSAWSTAHLPQEVIYQERTLRMVVEPAGGGQTFRIRISNAVGEQPVVLRNFHVGIAGDGASVKSGTNTPVTFHNGLTELQLPVGSEFFSDPVNLSFGPGDKLAVSVHIAGAAQFPAGHALGTTYLTPDFSPDLSAQESDVGFVEQANQFFYLSSIEISRTDSRGVLVAIGDSITDGVGAGWTSSWPRLLQRRILQDETAPVQAVLNAGIGSNRLLGDGCFVGGPQLRNRLVRDVITQAKATDVIILIGTNDIAVPTPTSLRSAEAIIDGLVEVIAKLKAFGLNVAGGTLVPSKGGNPWATHGDPNAIATRNEVNEWIRNSGAFDTVIDFAKIMADPNDPDRLNPVYDSGDGLHPNAVGYQAMADAIDIELLSGVRAKVESSALAPDPAEACSPPL